MIVFLLATSQSSTTIEKPNTEALTNMYISSIYPGSNG